MSYAKLFRTMEKLTKSFHDSIKVALQNQGIFDINVQQAMIIYYVGHKTVIVGDIEKYGYYKGANCSYSINSLVKNGYVDKQKNDSDGRSSVVSLTESGINIFYAISRATKLMEEKFSDHKINILLDRLNIELINMGIID